MKLDKEGGRFYREGTHLWSIEEVMYLYNVPSTMRGPASNVGYEKEAKARCQKIY